MTSAFLKPTPPVEIARFTNPSRTLDAIFSKVPTGATDPTYYRVYLTQHGSEIVGEPVFHAADASGSILSWEDDSTLRLEHSSRRVYRSQASRPVETPQGRVEVRIKVHVREAQE